MDLKTKTISASSNISLPAIHGSSSTTSIAIPIEGTNRNSLTKSVSTTDTSKAQTTSSTFQKERPGRNNQTEDQAPEKQQKRRSQKVNVKDEVMRANASIDNQNMVIRHRHSAQCDAMDLKLLKVKEETDKIMEKCINNLLHKQVGGYGQELNSYYSYMKQGVEARNTHSKNIRVINESREDRMRILDEKVQQLEKEVL